MKTPYRIPITRKMGRREQGRSIVYIYGAPLPRVNCAIYLHTPEIRRCKTKKKGGDGKTILCHRLRTLLQRHSPSAAAADEFLSQGGTTLGARISFQNRYYTVRCSRDILAQRRRLKVCLLRHLFPFLKRSFIRLVETKIRRSRVRTKSGETSRACAKKKRLEMSSKK